MESFGEVTWETVEEEIRGAFAIMPLKEFMRLATDIVAIVETGVEPC